MTETEDDRATVTTRELAQDVGRQPSTVQKWIREGYLYAVTVGREYRISKADANAWWQSRGGGLLYPEAGIGEVPDDADEAQIQPPADADGGDPDDE